MVFRAFSCTFFGGRKADESHHFFEAGRLLWNVDISGQGGNQIRYAIVIRIIRGRILRWVWMKGVMRGARFGGEFLVSFQDACLILRPGVREVWTDVCPKMVLRVEFYLVVGISGAPH